MEQSALVEQLEALARAAWPAVETACCHGWQLRWAYGYTKRSNSAAAVAPEGDFDLVLRTAEAFYRSRGLPAVFRVSPLAGTRADDALAARGYRSADPTRVMTLALDALDAGFLAADVPGFDECPHEEWLAAFAGAAALGADECAAHGAILAAVAPRKLFGLVRAPDRTPCALGTAVLDGDEVGLFNLLTVPGRRRQGLGRRLLAGLLGRAREAGARSAWLQVSADNAPAVALYEGLGFVEAYRYHYRLAVEPAPR